MKLSEICLAPDKMYFLFPAAKGDTFLESFLVRVLEEKYNVQIVLIIKEDHKFIAQLLNMNFICADWQNENLMEFPAVCSNPQKGKIFIAHPEFHKEIFFDPSLPLMSIWKTLFGLPLETKVDFRFSVPALPSDLAQKLEKIAPLKKIVLFSVHSFSHPGIANEFWENLAVVMKKKGFVPICSVLQEKDAVPGTIYLPMDCEQAFLLAHHCHSVYALRSGFADLCFQLGSRLTVFYSLESTYRLTGMNKNFHRQDIVEKVVTGEKDKITKFYFLKKIHFLTITKQINTFCLSFFGLPVFKAVKQNEKTIWSLFGLPVLSKKTKKEFDISWLLNRK